MFGLGLLPNKPREPRSLQYVDLCNVLSALSERCIMLIREAFNKKNHFLIDIRQ